MLARGITGNITGARADIIICDDVEVPNTAATSDLRESLRERLKELEFILTPGGMILYIGTPHTYFSIYADNPRDEIGEDKAFLQGYERLKLPILDEEGESVWPERFSFDSIARQKRESGPNAFASQMMLRPVNILNSRLDVKLLQKYDEKLHCYEAQGQMHLRLGDKKIVSASAWWDPAFGAAGGDDSVVAIVYTDDGGDQWIHHVEYIKTIESDEDEATQQCKIVADLAKRFYLPSIAVEINGIGRFLPSILRNELTAAKLQTGVTEMTSKIAKHERILAAFDAPMAAQRLHVHKNVYQTSFVIEMQEWQPTLKHARDDGLDAAAGALSLEPVRIKRNYVDHFSKGWRAQTHTANTDFNI